MIFVQHFRYISWIYGIFLSSTNIYLVKCYRRFMRPFAFRLPTPVSKDFLDLYFFKDWRYLQEILWTDAQYHDAVCCFI